MKQFKIGGVPEHFNLPWRLAIEDGDFAIIDFEGFVDNVAFEGGKGENHSLEIGSGQFIPGFEEQLIGFNNNEDIIYDELIS